MGLLGWFGKASDSWKVIVLTVLLSLVLSPEFLHGQNSILGLGPAVGKVTAQDLTLFFEPASPNTKDKPPAREMIEGGHLFGQQ